MSKTRVGYSYKCSCGFDTSEIPYLYDEDQEMDIVNVDELMKLDQYTRQILTECPKCHKEFRLRYIDFNYSNVGDGNE